MNIDDLRTQIIEHGALTDDQKKALVEKGRVPEMLVDEYVELAKFRLEQTTADAIDYAGGAEDWNAISKWASDNLEASEKQHVNGLLAGTDYKLGIDLIKTKMAQGGVESQLISGDRPGGGSVAGFASRKEMTDAINDPKYKTDGAYRTEVR